ncbi:hypothetical protein ABZ508_33735 [Streptomyces lavendulocolor]|uniref:Uncharacterized protein n=1 Tax=Streptomyces lavendulocolor TaxID=67316 RepID=A0ABV2WG40_9ACTN
MEHGQVLASSGGRFVNLLLGLLPEWLEWAFLAVMAALLLWFVAGKIRDAVRA